MDEQLFYIERDNQIIGQIIGYVDNHYSDVVALPANVPLNPGDVLVLAD